MAIELVTGHAGQEHVSSADAGRLNAGVCGTGKYVLNTGLKFAYSIESANLIRIASGDAVNQGRHITIPQNTYEDAALLNGAQGKTRIDVITLRYSKVTRQVDSETVTLEEASVEVVKGTEVPTGTTPEVPAVVSGNIFGGATADDMPLYHVLITDTSVTSVTPVFTVMPSIDDMKQDTDGLYQDILTLQETARTHGVDLTKVKNLLGDGPLDTVSQNVVGAVAELLQSISAIQTAMGGVKAKAVIREGISLPAGGGGISQTLISFKDVLPSGVHLVGIDMTLGDFHLPYVQDGRAVTWVSKLWERNIRIDNSSSAWNNYAMFAVLFYTEVTP